MDAIRAFIAIELPSAILGEVDKVEARLKPQVPPDTVRWVKADSIHLTLKFLGQVPSDQLETDHFGAAHCRGLTCALHVGGGRRGLLSQCPSSARGVGGC